MAWSQPVTVLLRGLGQIMLQENAATGLLFLTGLVWASPVLGLAALLAAGCGTLTALLLRFGKEATVQGLYGFSSALTGVALVLFRGDGPWVWAGVAAGSAAAAVFQHFFLKQKLPAFTLPFVLVTWVLLRALPEAPPSFHDPVSALPGGTLVNALVRGFGQVIFQVDPISGLLFIAGVALRSRTAVVFGMAGALLAGLLALGLGQPAASVALGLWSYNAVLCAIAVAGTGRRNYVLFLITVPLAVLIGMAMVQLPLPQLTFPFVVATGGTLLMEQWIVRRKRDRA